MYFGFRLAAWYKQWDGKCPVEDERLALTGRSEEPWVLAYEVEESVGPLCFQGRTEKIIKA